MKPWEAEETIKISRKMSGEETIKVGIELTEYALKVLSSSIKNENPNISPQRLKRELEKIIWKIRPEVMKKF